MTERWAAVHARRHRRVLVIAATLLSSPALAEPASAPSVSVSNDAEGAARELFREGNALFDAGQYDEARSKFEQAYAAWTNPKILLNLATTLRALGRNAAALQAYLRYSSELQPNVERKAEVDAICAELRARVATVRVDIQSDVLRVTLDDTPLDTRASAALYLEPGEHVLVSFGAAGERRLPFSVAAGESRTLTASAPVVPRVEEAPPKVEEPARDSGLAVLGRADIDGRGRGVLGAIGLGYTLGAGWQVEAGALVGNRRGAWAGLALFLGDGWLSPSFGLSAPVFFIESAHVGVSLDAGARLALGAGFFLRGRASVVHFPSVPEGYSRTVFVPSLGVEWQL
jgi:hypothetical protein